MFLVYMQENMYTYQGVIIFYNINQNTQYKSNSKELQNYNC
jgi:hypothetical protein